MPGHRPTLAPSPNERLNSSSARSFDATSSSAGSLSIPPTSSSEWVRRLKRRYLAYLNPAEASRSMETGQEFLAIDHASAVCASIFAVGVANFRGVRQPQNLRAAATLAPAASRRTFVSRSWLGSILLRWSGAATAMPPKTTPTATCCAGPASSWWRRCGRLRSWSPWSLPFTSM